jgi:hypothetical protein
MSLRGVKRRSNPQWWDCEIATGCRPRNDMSEDLCCSWQLNDYPDFTICQKN